MTDQQTHADATGDAAENPDSGFQQEKYKIEAAALRRIVSRCAAAVGNGTYIAPEATVATMSLLPGEIDALRRRALPATAGICGLDRDECTVTIALDSATQVEDLLTRIQPRSRVNVLDPMQALLAGKRHSGRSFSLRAFLNALRIMTSIDKGELEEVGAIDPGDDVSWLKFREDPFYWLVRAEDRRAEKVWTIIERRM